MDRWKDDNDRNNTLQPEEDGGKTDGKYPSVELTELYYEQNAVDSNIM